jgi:hypothetical protein
MLVPAIPLLIEAGMAAAAITPAMIAAFDALVSKGVSDQEAAAAIAAKANSVGSIGSPGASAPSANSPRARAPGASAVRRVRGSAQPAAPTPPASSKFKSFAKGVGGNLGTAAAFAVLPMLAMRLFDGSPEDQVRRSMEIQEQMEAERMARMGGAGSGGGGDAALLAALGGGGGGVEGLIDGGRPMDSAELKYNNDLTKHVSDLAYKMKAARDARPSANNELERIIAGESARIASLQSERVLTPLEIIQFAEMSHGAIP